MRTITLKNKKQIVLNSDIELGEQEGNGKGRYFVSRFIEPGIAHYDELGDILITKETLNQFIQTMVGCPVIIDHEDVTDKNVDKLRVGSVSKVWFNEYDGYFYCEGILTDPQAIDLVKNKGWNVSCAYSFQSVPKDMHNGKKIDLEFIDGEFLHLAIVKNPRYEGANIVVNKKDDEKGKWITVKGTHIFIPEGKDAGEIIEKKFGGTEGYHARKDYELLEQIHGYKEDVSEYQKRQEEKQSDTKEKSKENKSYFKPAKGILQSLKDDYEAGKISAKDVAKELSKANLTPYILDDDEALEKIGVKQSDKQDKKATNSIGEITMQVLNELKEFIKSVVSNEKEDEMKVKNEDKRKLIDEVGGILKGKVDEELWRTVIGKLEKVAYEPSEDDKADNKAKNEEDEEKEAKNKCKNEEDKKDEDKADNEDDKDDDKDDDVTENEDDDKKEDDDKAENKKVKNSLKDIVMGGNGQAKEQKLYTSRKERLEEGNKY